MKEMKNLNILRLGNFGEGIAVENGKVAFIPFSLPNENVDAILEKESKAFNTYKLVKINKESEFRVKNECPYYKECGGCELQHLDYDKSLIFKEQNLANTIQKIAKVMVPVSPVMPSYLIYNYRNKCAFPVESRNGKTLAGFYKKNSKYILDIDQCSIAKDEINKCFSIVKQFVVKNNLGFDYYTNTGFIKHIVVRCIKNNPQIVLVTKFANVPNLMELVNDLKQNFVDFDLFLNINSLDRGEIFSSNFKLIYGKNRVKERSFGINYFISPYSFYQVNNYIRDIIYKKILEEIPDNGIVVDAYSGSGLLSAIVSKKSKYVYAIEINKSATENANELVKNNNINNMENINGDCANEIPKLIKRLNTNNLSVILDPARNGCDQNTLDSVCGSGAKRVIYLSCNPATLARDLITLLNSYEIKLIQPYDMFPQTSNLETLVVLERVKEL